MKSIGTAPLLKQVKYKISPRPRWRGFSFALHPDTVQGFCFARMQYSPIQAFTACFAVSMNYTTNATKQRTGLYSDLSCDCTRSTAHDTRPTQQAIVTPATRWRAYTRPDALNRYQIQPPRLDTAQTSTGRLL